MIDRRPEGCAVLCGAEIRAFDLALPWTDPAAQWGLGVFETLAVAGGAARDVDEHLERLGGAAQRLTVPLPAANDLARAVRVVAEGTTSPQAWLKIVASRSGTWAVYAGPIEPSLVGAAVSAVILPWRRHRSDPTVGRKSISYAASMLGLEEAHRRGADEGLWLNERGHLIGACAANVFVARGRAVTTPSFADGARDGVMRAHALRALRELGFSARSSKVRVTSLRAADEIFLTSSVRGVRPVVRLDGRDVRGGRPGAIARRLAERLTAAHASQGA